MLLLRWGYAPNEVRLALRPILLQHLFLVPGWCRQLYVNYYKQDGEADATTSCDPEYRQAHIAFHAGWLDCDPMQRRLEVIHELLHIPIAPMSQEQDAAIARLFEDGDAPKFKATLEEQWRKAMEGTVQDLAFSIAAIDPAVLPSVAYTEVEDEHPRLVDDAAA